MSLWQTLGIAILLSFIIFITRETKLSPLVISASGILLFSLLLERYRGVVEKLGALADAGGVSEELSFMLKAGGIALAAHLCSGLCRDMGHGSIADKVELLAKAEMLIISLPVIERLFTLFT